jgi:hypothetical protein
VEFYLREDPRGDRAGGGGAGHAHRLALERAVGEPLESRWREPLESRWRAHRLALRQHAVRAAPRGLSRSSSKITPEGGRYCAGYQVLYAVPARRRSTG